MSTPPTSFILPCQIVDTGTIAKANCLMASTSRIDERNTMRMYVFDKQGRVTKEGKKKMKKYVGRPMTVMEREKLMGFPVGYVEKPVQALFQELLENGISNRDWRKNLDRKYHHFAGNYHKLTDAEPFKFVFIPRGLTGELRMKMAPPPSAQSPVRDS